MTMDLTLPPAMHTYAPATDSWRLVSAAVEGASRLSPKFGTSGMQDALAPERYSSEPEASGCKHAVLQT